MIQTSAQWIRRKLPVLAGSLATFVLLIAFQNCSQAVVVDVTPTPVRILSQTVHGVPGSYMVVPINLNRAPTADATIQWQTQDGTAIAGVDYIAASGTLSIPAGTTQTTVQIQTTTENIPSKTFYIVLQGTLVNPQPSMISLFDSGMVTAILNSNLPTLTVAPLTSTTDEGQTQTFRVSLSLPTLAPVSFNWTLTSLTASVGVELPSQAGNLTIPSGQSYVDITVDTSNYTYYEGFKGNLTYDLQVSNIQNTTNSTATAQGSIVSTDTISVNVTANQPAYYAGDTAQFTVQLSMPVDGTTTCTYATQDGTGQANVQYVPANGNVVFAPGQTSQIVDVYFLRYSSGGPYTVTLNVTCSFAEPD